MNAHGLFRIWRRVASWGLCSFLFVSSAAAQGATSGINGKIADTTGGALPGVTVTITSPALQVPSMTTVSEPDGTYRFIQLPAGTYEVKYELSGFKSSVRQGVVLAVGFIATINPSLEVGGLEETITVSGASPVVDTTNNTITSRLSVSEMSSIPNSRRPNDIAMMTPGMAISTMPTSTAIGLAGLGNSVSSGGLANYRISADGIQQNSTSPRNVDMANVAEVDVTQSGGTADIGQAGIYVNVVSKAGGNDLHGRYAGLFTGSSLQSKNIDAALNAQGITTAASTTSYFTDINGDLGGKFVKDKLWFYVSDRDRRNKVGTFGAVEGPHFANSTEPFLPTALNNVWNAKLTYQINSKYQLTGFANQEYNDDFGGGLSRFIPHENSRELKYNPLMAKGEIKATFTNRLLLSAMVARDHSYPTYFAAAGAEKLPTTQDLATQQMTGRSYPLDKRERSNWEIRSDVTFLPSGKLLGLFGGNHELKVGGYYWYAFIDTAHQDDPVGNYILVFNTLGGVPHTPSQIKFYNAPITPHSPTVYSASYITDRVTAGRLTMNLGFRFEHYHAWIPPQTKPAAQVNLWPLSAALDIPLIEVGTFNMPAPRAGFSYDLSGNGKTVLKGTYGWFNDEMNEAYGGDYNPNVDNIGTYTWHDLNKDNLYQPGEVNTALNGPDFLSVSGALANIVNPDLKWQYIHELTGSFERELTAGMGLRFLYTYRKYGRETAWLNIKRPYSAYTIPIASKDPGPDGRTGTADDGGPVTVWTYPAAYAGAAFVGQLKSNIPDGDHFNTYELTLNKRFSQKWQATLSGSVVQNHQGQRANSSDTVPGGTTGGLNALLPQSPNEDYFPLITTRPWTAKATVSYVLPLDIRVSTLAFFENGVFGGRTFAFPGIPQAGTVTLRLERDGAQQGPVRKVVNLRLSKLVKFGKKTAEGYVDFNNIINDNTPWGITYQSGPTFGYATNVFPARLIQFGGSFEF